jgi:inner membrane protein
MASLISHAIVGLTASRCLPARPKTYKLWFWSAVCAIAPDVDVIAFFFGIPYESQWGHRGFTHSIVFALALGLAVGATFARAWPRRLAYGAYFALVTATHPFLDALTNGGLGIAFFWPFDAGRYFFPDRPIEVSPIGISPFLSMRGLEVLASEFYVVMLPCLALLAVREAVVRLAWKKS